MFHKYILEMFEKVTNNFISLNKFGSYKFFSKVMHKFT
jgi:hypothetical protein